MTMTNAVLSALSLGQKNLANVAATTRVAPSALIKWSHLTERIGLAIVGGSCGLFVAAGLMHKGNDLFGSDLIVLLMMLYGAFGFYFGIDLPSRPGRRAAPTRPEEWNGTHAVEIFSAAGTFLAAMAMFLSITIIVLDETMSDGLTVLVGCGWAIGSSLQIAAGTIVRRTGIVEDGGK